MSRVRFGYGWLFYAGILGGGPEAGLAVAGDVTDIEVSVERGAVNVTPFGSPHLAQVAGPTVVSVRAELGCGAKMIRGKPESEALWECLRSWAGPGPGAPDGRRWPPQFRAMAELARRHPEEYRALLAAETAAEPLRVARHSWVNG